MADGTSSGMQTVDDNRLTSQALEMNGGHVISSDGATQSVCFLLLFQCVQHTLSVIV